MQSLVEGFKFDWNLQSGKNEAYELENHINRSRINLILVENFIFSKITSFVSSYQSSLENVMLHWKKLINEIGLFSEKFPLKKKVLGCDRKMRFCMKNDNFHEQFSCKIIHTCDQVDSL